MFNGKAKQCMDQVEEFIQKEFEDRLKQLEDRFRSGNQEEIEAAYNQAMEAHKVRKALREAPQVAKEVPLYLTEYVFLKEAYKSLTKTKKEGFCIVTGPEDEGRLFALTRKIQPEMEAQSMVSAEPDFGSLTDLLVKIDEREGARLCSYFHSHPGTGAGATQPSGVDMDLQEKLERGGYPVIGAIFSKDGWVRFFSHHRKFVIKVSGKGGEQVEESLFKLSKDKVREVHHSHLDSQP